jgi:SAM-dependent methyltransferase
VDDEERLRLGAVFDEGADGYDARPGYPAETYRILADRCRLAAGSRVLEIGPGTGQATIGLLDAGAEVTAVEPGAALARRLAERTAGRPVSIVNAGFEDAVLPEAAFDIVAAATSFHWVDPTIAISKVAGHLRPGGWIALWWNVFFDAARPDLFSTALGNMLADVAPELHVDWRLDTVAFPLDVDARSAEIEASASFGPVEHHLVAWEGHHDAVGIRRLFGTYSPWLALPPERRLIALDALERLAREDFADRVVRPYQTSIYLAPRTDG